MITQYAGREDCRKALGIAIPIHSDAARRTESPTTTVSGFIGRESGVRRDTGENPAVPLKEALAAYETAVRLDPDYANAHRSRGYCLSQLGTTTEALAAYDTAIRLKPDYAQAYKDRGDCLSKTSTTEALAAYDTAIKLKPDYAQAYKSRGDCSWRSANYKEALVAYEKVLELMPDAIGYKNCGDCLKALGRTTEALAAYNRAIALAPDYTQLYSDRKDCLSALRRETKSPTTTVIGGAIGRESRVGGVTYESPAVPVTIRGRCMV